MAGVKFEKVSKSYTGRDGARAVDSLDLDIADGEFMVLVGPSGCGKSTALRMIAGLEEITDGKLFIGDEVVNDVPPADRDIAMVFQNYALYPHMTVRENMGFALETAGVKKDEIKRRVEAAASILGLEEYLDRLPRALSGGQRQRVAMGRAIVRSPKVFLMDEPLSNLDAKLRVQMRSEIIQLQARLGTTMVYVTHDQVEAMTMGHRVAVMRHGVLQQVAPPQELYQRPANLFVAAFIGSPAMNLVHGRVTTDGTSYAVEFGGHRLDLGITTLERYPLVTERVGDDVVVGIRPEHFDMAGDGDYPANRRMAVTVLLAESMGAEAHVHFAVPAESAGLDGRDVGTERGDETPETIALASEGTPMIARIDGMNQVHTGDEIELGVKTDRIHFFDVRTGSPLR